MAEPVHRTKRDQARAHLMRVARSLLEQRSWSSLTIAQLAGAAGWSRTAFYQHFADREQLLTAMLFDLDTAFHGVAQQWMQGGHDPVVEHRTAIRALVDVYVEHGRVLRTARDMSASDPTLRTAWNTIRDGIVDATTEAIERDMANGHAKVENPVEMSRALSALTEQYLLLSFGDAPLRDPASVADTLATVWTRSLYPDEKQARDGARSPSPTK